MWQPRSRKKLDTRQGLDDEQKEEIREDPWDGVGSGGNRLTGLVLATGDGWEWGIGMECTEVIGWIHDVRWIAAVSFWGITFSGTPQMKSLTWQVWEF